MIIKFLEPVKDSGLQAVKYLLDRFDANGEERKAVMVLRGDPILVGLIADTLKFKYRYTSGVLAWHLDDDPSVGEMLQVLNDVESVAFAGLDPSQYVYAAILHVGSDDSKHIHWFAARVELTSGKSFNVAPPGHSDASDAVQDKWNHRRGWARPDDESRKRLISPGPSLRSKRRNQNSGLVNNTPVNGFDEFELGEITPANLAEARFFMEELALRLVFGEGVRNRQELVDVCKKYGDVTREETDHISIKVHGTKKAIQLKGEIFSIDADYEAMRNAAIDRLADEGPLRAYAGEPERVVDETKAQEAQLRLDGWITSRTRYNRTRYPKLTFEPPTPQARVERISDAPVSDFKPEEEAALEESQLLYWRTPYLVALDELVDLIPELSTPSHPQTENLIYADNERTGNAAAERYKATARSTYKGHYRIDSAAKSVARCFDTVVGMCRRALEFMQAERGFLSRRSVKASNPKP